MNKKLWYLAAIIMAVVNIVMYLIIPLPERVFVLWDDFWELAAMVLATIFLLQASQVAGPEKRAFRLFALGFGGWSVGQVLWAGFDLFHPGAVPPFPHISDIGYFAFYIFVLFGLFALLRHYVSVVSKAQWVTAAGVLIVLLAIAFPFVLLPVVRSGEMSWLGKFLSFAYPFLDVVVIACLLPVISMFAGGKIGQSWLITAVGFVAIAGADIVFTYLQLAGGYSNGNTFALLWVLGGLLVMVGSLRFIESHTKTT